MASEYLVDNGTARRSMELVSTPLWQLDDLKRLFSRVNHGLEAIQVGVNCLNTGGVDRDLAAKIP
jgi:hypothetical protein